MIHRLPTVILSLMVGLLMVLSASAQELAAPSQLDRQALLQRMAQEVARTPEPELQEQLQLLAALIEGGEMPDDRQVVRAYRDIWGDYHRRAAMHWFEQGQANRAEPHITSGLESAPWHLPLRAMAAHEFEQRGRIEDAVGILAGGVPFARDGDEPYVQATLNFLHENGAAREALYMAFGALGQFENVEFRSDLARRATRQLLGYGQFEEAQMLVEKFRLSQTSLALLLEAEAAAMAGETAQALPLLTQGQQRFPHETRFSELLLDALLKQGRYEEATRVVDAAFAALPNTLHPALLRLRVLHALGEDTQVAEEVEQMIPSCNGLPQHQDLAEVLARQGRPELVQAVRAHAIAEDLDTATLELRHLQALVVAGEFETFAEAAASFRRQQQPLAPSWRAQLELWLGVNWLLQGEPTQAAQEFTAINFRFLPNTHLLQAYEACAESEFAAGLRPLLDAYLDFFTDDRRIERLRSRLPTP